LPTFINTAACSVFKVQFFTMASKSATVTSFGAAGEEEEEEEEDEEEEEEEEVKKKEERELQE
jgi:ribosomal protein L12E/L44/L45/RPP1/RPP2